MRKFAPSRKYFTQRGPLSAAYFMCFVKPRTAADKCTKADVYLNRSFALCQPKLQMSTVQKVDAPFRPPLMPTPPVVRKLYCLKVLGV